MDTDQGLVRRLPEPLLPGQKAEPLRLKERNVLPVDLTADDEVLCDGRLVSADELRRRVKEFVANPSDSEDLPEKMSVSFPYFGVLSVTKNHVISLCCDRNASYKAYMDVQNALVAAYNELRDELARTKWQKNYAELTPEQKRAVRQVYPQRKTDNACLEHLVVARLDIYAAVLLHDCYHHARSHPESGV